MANYLMQVIQNTIQVFNRPRTGTPINVIEDEHGNYSSPVCRQEFISPTCHIRTFLLLVFAFPVAVQGQSALHFARAFTPSDLRTVAFTVVNPSTDHAAVTFTLYAPDGQTVATSLETVRAGGQLRKTGYGAAGLFPDINIGGWVQAASSTPGLQGFWFGGDSSTFSDGADAAPAATRLVLPLLSTRTELNIANPNRFAALITLTLFGADGIEVGFSESRSIEAHGIFQHDLSALFPSANFSQPTQLRISSTEPVTATAVLRDFLASPSWGVMNGTDSSITATEIHFPHVPAGSSWLTLIGISNLEASEQSVTITFIPAGKTADASVSVRRIIPPNGLLRETAQSLFNVLTGDEDGWVQVQGGGSLRGFVAYTETSAGGVAVAAMHPVPRTSLLFAHVADEPPQWWTGLALLNTTSTDAAVEVQVLRYDGSLVGGPANAPATARFILKAGTKRSGLLSEFVPQSRFNDGFVVVRTTNDVPLFGIALVFTRDLNVMASIPAGALDGQVSMTPRIDALLEPIRGKYHLPALGAAILTSNNVVGIGAVGVRKAGSTVRVTVDDQWHLGSDTKAMTATLIGALVEQGSLSWETTIEQAFPDLVPSMHADQRGISLLHLLSHQAGLPANLNWEQIASTGNLRQQRERAVRVATSVRPLWQPGSRYAYSNLGYVIAGAMAERIVGNSWESLMVEKLFHPLGMNRTGFGGTGTPGQLDQPWPHRGDGTPTSNGPAADNPPVLGPAGGVHSTLSDWARFISDQLLGARSEPAMLARAIYRRLHTAPFGGSYALGWGTGERAWSGGPVLFQLGQQHDEFRRGMGRAGTRLCRARCYQQRSQ